MTGGLLCLLAVVAEPIELQTAYEGARRYDGATFRYAAPSMERLRGILPLVRDLTAAARARRPMAPLQSAARAVGLELVAGRDRAGELWILGEGPGRRAGDGLYVFRPGGVPIVVQAPHTFYDEHTGDIGLEVFAELRALTLFVNTVHRYARTADGPREAGGDGRITARSEEESGHAVSADADVAHAPRSLFLSATEGVLAADPHLPIVQVHGFATRPAGPPDLVAIVSAGVRPSTSRPSPSTARAAGAGAGAGGDPVDAAARFRQALQARVPGKVLLFGVDAEELGATTNVEGRAIRRVGGTFLHVEMAPGLRSRPASIGRALAEALREALALGS